MSEYTRKVILEMIEKVGGPQHLHLSGADLSGIDLSGTTGGLNLQQANFERANLQKANLRGINFQEAKLRQANLHEAKLMQANLQKAKLTQANLEKASLRWANLQGARLRVARLQRADLAWANLQEADLGGAKLQGANLRGVRLQEADLAGANLQKANLSMAHLERAHMYDIESVGGAYFYGAFLDQTRMRKEHLGRQIGEKVDKEYYKAKEAYLLLKNNFNQIGRYDDASWAYIKERQMDKMTYHPKLARKYYAKIEGLPEEASRRSWAWWCFYVKYTLKWLWDWTIEWSSGYGERPQNVLAVASVVLIIFPFLYFLTGLAPRSGQNLLWRDYFLYSLYSFASMEHPTLQATCWIAQLFTGLESLSGIALLALLMYTLGRRISRS